MANFYDSWKIFIGNTKCNKYNTNISKIKLDTKIYKHRHTKYANTGVYRYMCVCHLPIYKILYIICIYIYANIHAYPKHYYHVGINEISLTIIRQS